MTANVCQRWRSRRDSYRPAGEPIDPLRYEVAALSTDSVARAFVELHHYSGTYPAARRRFGLWRAGALVGVAVFSVPTNPRSLACLPDPAGSAELGRFVLLDDVPANGETWLLGRCFELLRRDGFSGVVSFSDPAARTTSSGSMVHPGHVGTIYQAHNAVYLGRAARNTVHLLPDGRALSARAMAKIRQREVGWRYSSRQLELAGAAALTETEDAAAWLAHWLPRVTRRFRHPGNHKYAWTLHRRDRRFLPASQPYPKLVAANLRGAA